MNFPGKQTNKKINTTKVLCHLFIHICINETGTNNPRKSTHETSKYGRQKVIFYIQMNVCLLFQAAPERGLTSGCSGFYN